jgi:hypothetical protein
MKPFTLKQPASMSSVAKNLGFSDLHPLQSCNEALRRKRPDDVLPAGTRLAIPLKEAEYDRIIKTLEALKQQVRDDMNITLKDLEDAKRTADRWTTGVDFIADIAKILVGDGAAAIKYRGIVRRQHIEKVAIQSLQKVTVVLGDYDERGATGKAADTLGDALADNALKQKPVTLMRGTARSLVTEGVKLVVNKEAHDRLGETAGLVADMVLDQKPSAIAKLWITWRTGESPDSTYNQAKVLVQRTADRSWSRLTDSITRLSKEKRQAYGTGAN